MTATGDGFARDAALAGAIDRLLLPHDSIEQTTAIILSDDHAAERAEAIADLVCAAKNVGYVLSNDDHYLVGGFDISWE